MSPLFQVPVHLVVALSVATTTPKGLDARDAHAAEFERSASRPVSVLRISEAPSGPYLFTSEAWLSIARDTAPITLARRIFKTSSGRHYMAPGDARDILLSLRTDPELAAAMARQLAHHNQTALTKVLGRPATTGELVLAHLTGAAAAARLIEAQRTNPETTIASLCTAECVGLFALAPRAAKATAGDVQRNLIASTDLELARVRNTVTLKGTRPADVPAVTSGWQTTVAQKSISGRAPAPQ
jgi:hypothetical protein